ncbi:alpha/beta fold hydrolase [Pseudomonas syringae]|uniref:Alpha/beta fold hydrolase n=2 Tax=Pseudomonas syringae group TaxID=136849 RepID=A0A9Q4FGH3_PSESX|nr:alpha/beta hydrolase [Pseudomonas syringae]KTB62777.1 alpha/beta hydrolase [Pseudomonas viridiflava ICMP 13104]MCF5470785.1 alpha/beta fold hydrolase [Pseudomonas syringae]MCF5471884.1 alpha/beta fold hydrolase [Pseudomonas syringae]MCF5482861.1 alpha/beta fold hydrolase [Pseudomonas syringae]MCF5490733.1 alpha/beta fold hydrolase [Pseudomonas syringae]
MSRTLFLRTLRTIWLVALLVELSSMAMAADKRYTVTAPDGLKLAVQESGDPNGPAIIFVHGLLGSRLNWEKQTSSPELHRYRMITYDLRGHGLSDKPENVDAYRDGRRYADDLAAVIDATGSKRPVLVGWSLGGVVMSNYLAAYGDTRIGGVMYVDGVIELNAALITAHPQVYAGLASEDLKTHLDAVRTFLGLCFHTRPDTATFEQLLSSAAMASWTMTRVTPSMTVAVAEGLPKARVPVLLLYGGKDELVKVQPSIARARQLNARVQSSVYESSGHAPFLEEASRFNHDLATFVESAVGVKKGSY